MSETVFIIITKRKKPAKGFAFPQMSGQAKKEKGGRYKYTEFKAVKMSAYIAYLAAHAFSFQNNPYTV